MDYITRDKVVSLIKQDAEYPINFDKLIKWCGVNETRSRALHLLITNFTCDVEYVRLSNTPDLINSIYLRWDASKEFASMVKTPAGKAYRDLLIKTEKELGVFGDYGIFKVKENQLNSNTHEIGLLHDVVINLNLEFTILKDKIERLEGASVLVHTPLKLSNVNENSNVTNSNSNSDSNKETRQKLVDLVTGYAKQKAFEDKDSYRNAWNLLYCEFKQKVQIDLKRKAKAAKFDTTLEYVCTYRLLPLLYEIALETFTFA